MIILYPENEQQFISNGLGILTDAITCTVTEELNGSFELEMEYPVSGHHYSDIGLRKIIFAKPNDSTAPQPFRIYSITKPFNGVVAISAEHISYDTNGYLLRPIKFDQLPKDDNELYLLIEEGKVTDNGNNTYTSEHGYVFGKNDKGLYDEFIHLDDILNKIPTVAITSIYPFTIIRASDKENKAGRIETLSPSNLRSLLGGSDTSIAELFEGEWEFDKYAITLHSKRGSNKGFEIRYGKNMTDLEQEIKSTNLYSGIFPYYYKHVTETETKTSQVYQVAKLVQPEALNSLTIKDLFEYSNSWLTTSADGLPLKTLVEDPPVTVPELFNVSTNPNPIYGFKKTIKPLFLNDETLVIAYNRPPSIGGIGGIADLLKSHPSDWLSLTPGGDPLKPDPKKIYKVYDKDDNIKFLGYFVIKGAEPDWDGYTEHPMFKQHNIKIKRKIDPSDPVEYLIQVSGPGNKLYTSDLNKIYLDDPNNPLIIVRGTSVWATIGTSSMATGNLRMMTPGKNFGRLYTLHSDEGGYFIKVTEEVIISTEDPNYLTSDDGVLITGRYNKEDLLISTFYDNEMYKVRIYDLEDEDGNPLLINSDAYAYNINNMQVRLLNPDSKIWEYVNHPLWVSRIPDISKTVFLMDTAGENKDKYFKLFKTNVHGQSTSAYSKYVLGLCEEKSPEQPKFEWKPLSGNFNEREIGVMTNPGEEYGRNFVLHPGDPDRLHRYSGVAGFFFKPNPFPAPKLPQPVSVTIEKDEYYDLSEYDDPSIQNGIIYIPGHENDTPKKILQVDLTDRFDKLPDSQEEKDIFKSVADAYISDNIDSLSKIVDSLTVSFVKLSDSPEYERFKQLELVSLGDTVKVVYETFNIEQSMRVVETEYNVLTGRYNEVTLGEKVATLAQGVIQAGDSISSLNNDANFTDDIAVKQLVAKIINADYIYANYADIKAAIIKELEVGSIQASGLIKASAADIDEIVARQLTADDAKIKNVLESGEVKVAGDVTVKDGSIRLGEFYVEGMGGEPVQNHKLVIAEDGSININRGIFSVDAEGNVVAYSLELKVPQFKVEGGGENITTAFTVESNGDVETPRLRVRHYSNAFNPEETGLIEAKRIEVEQLVMTNPRNNIEVHELMFTGGARLYGDTADTFEEQTLTLGNVSLNWHGQAPDDPIALGSTITVTVMAAIQGNKTSWEDFIVSASFNYKRASDFKPVTGMVKLRFYEGSSGFVSASTTISNVGAYPTSATLSRYSVYQTKTITLSDNILSEGNILPTYSGSFSLGLQNNKWLDIYLNNQPSVGSDRKIKKDISYELSDYDKIFDELKPAMFKYVDGQSGRMHLGLIAQDIEDSLIENDIPTKDFAVFIKERKKIKDDERPEEELTEADYNYSLRYAELHALEIRQIQQLKLRVAELEKLLKREED